MSMYKANAHAAHAFFDLVTQPFRLTQIHRGTAYTRVTATQLRRQACPRDEPRRATQRDEGWTAARDARRLVTDTQLGLAWLGLPWAGLVWLALALGLLWAGHCRPSPSAFSIY